MPSIKYKVVYTANAAVPYEVVEYLDFTCECPETAAKAYINAIVQEFGYANAKVYPADNKPLFEATGATVAKPVPANKCCGGGSCCKEESNLYKGYAKEKVDINFGELPDAFDTPESTWIRAVQWSNGIIGIVFKNDNVAEYVCDWDTFNAFHVWVQAGGSAGRFFNANIKGVCSKY